MYTCVHDSLERLSLSRQEIQKDRAVFLVSTSVVEGRNKQTAHVPVKGKRDHPCFNDRSKTHQLKRLPFGTISRTDTCVDGFSTNY